MILYYAPGGGLGHLSRAKKIITQFSISEYRVITTSRFAKKIFPEQNLITISQSFSKNVEKLRIKIMDILDGIPLEKIYIDTFPAGISGELNGIIFNKSIEIIYICRLLKWEKYSFKIKSIEGFHKTLVIEEIDADHLNFVKNYSKKIEKIEIRPLKPTFNWEELSKKYDLSENKNFWIIVHSSNREELESLISYADDIAEIENKKPFFLIITDISINSPHKIINHYPANDFFPYAKKIISGCGFNIMNETENFQIKHRLIPFNRKYDNQFLRAKLRTAGNL